MRRVAVKNDSGANKTINGQVLGDGSVIELDTQEALEQFRANDVYVQDVSNQDLIILNQEGEIVEVAAAVAWLFQDNPSQVSINAPTDAEGALLSRSRAFASSDGFRARFQGIFSGTAEAGTTTDFDFRVAQERYINGVRLLLEDHTLGDKVDFQVVDIDNVLGMGANTVLDEFGKDWFVDPALHTQPDVLVPYPARILTGLYIRLKYHSSGSTDVKVKTNAFLHWKAS